ncbi:hypothetical protein ROHU_021887 [Labeo rohita]|uniref:Integrase catalytic domain-containing protein n=1 Tax=Labeo rohita TaxID=84645 RepID=A0A498MZG7_LABRO|nr:hypothetical protein ROHU_008296 [Labeo rohita]RXN24934.1 hypothetical protein ROHU_021887 [Labeo rohita]
MATPKSAPTSSQRPRRAVQRPACLDDYEVNYAGHPSGQAVRPKEKAVKTSTPISSYQPFGTAGSSEEFMLQIMEITKQQSETARRQTELLEKVLLHSTPQASTHSSRASSRHQTPRTQILQSVERGQPKSEVSPRDVGSDPPLWPQPAKPPPPFIEELSQALRKTQIRDSLFQSPPPVSRQTTLSSHQYVSPCRSAKSDQARTQLCDRAEPWMKPLPPPPEQRPSQPTQPPVYQHVKVPNAHRLVLAHAEAVTPYTNALKALDRRYGRPYQFVLREIEALENLPPIRAGDERAFYDFSLRVQAIVVMLKALKGDANCMKFDPTDETRATKRDQRAAIRGQSKQTTILHGVEQRRGVEPTTKSRPVHPKVSTKPKVICPYCSAEHYLSQCTTFTALIKEQMVCWIKDNKRCWKCARSHMAKDCDLKRPCYLCQAKHLSLLHDINQRTGEVTNGNSSLYNSTTETLYLDQPRCGGKVFLKVVKVTIHYQQKVLDTFAVLDDGSERTILLATAAQHLGLKDLLSNMDTDSFLMAVRRMVARRGTPSEILVDQGTNFRGGDKELQTAFTAMSPHLQTLSANQKIQFHYNPPNAPHFGGMWEREIRSVKSALHTIVGSQILTEEVLRTLLAEVEAILNAKPLGYVSSDVAV